MRGLLLLVLLLLSSHSVMAQQIDGPMYSHVGNGYDPYYLQPAPVATTPTYVVAAPSYATASAYTPSAHYNWTSCYLGIYAGGAFGGDVNANEAASQGGTWAAGTSYNVLSSPYGYSTGDSFIGGGTVGCSYETPVNWGRADGIVLGVEGEFGRLDNMGNGIDPNNINVNDRDTLDKTSLGDWDAIAAVRAGVAFNRALVYAKLGAFFANAKSTIQDNCTVLPCGPGTINATGQKTLMDAALGAGIEYALSPSWSVKGEYMFLNTADNYEVCGAGGAQAAGSNYCSEHKLGNTQMLKVGLNYHFDHLFGGKR